MCVSIKATGMLITNATPTAVEGMERFLNFKITNVGGVDKIQPRQAEWLPPAVMT